MISNKTKDQLRIIHDSTNSANSLKDDSDMQIKHYDSHTQKLKKFLNLVELSNMVEHETRQHMNANGREDIKSQMERQKQIYNLVVNGMWDPDSSNAQNMSTSAMAMAPQHGKQSFKERKLEDNKILRNDKIDPGAWIQFQNLLTMDPSH